MALGGNTELLRTAEEVEVGEHGSRIQRLIFFRRVLVDILHSPTGSFWLVRARRAGCSVHSDACIRGCSRARQVGRLPDSVLASEDVERVQPTLMVTSMGVSEREARSCMRSVWDLARGAGQTLYAR